MVCRARLETGSDSIKRYSSFILCRMEAYFTSLHPKKKDELFSSNSNGDVQKKVTPLQ